MGKCVEIAPRNNTFRVRTHPSSFRRLSVGLAAIVLFILYYRIGDGESNVKTWSVVFVLSFIKLFCVVCILNMSVCLKACSHVFFLGMQFLVIKLRK